MRLAAASGIYFVERREQGVVLRFGQFVARTAPGINYHLPWPIETAYTPEVTQREPDQHRLPPGRRTPTTTTQTEDVPEESLMLTGDENIVDVNFTVFWVIKDAADYLFNVEDPDADDQGGGRKRHARGRRRRTRSSPSSPRTASPSRSRCAS